MTDLPTVLPTFPTKAYTHLLPSLDRHGITVADLLSLDALEVARRATLPIPDLRKLADAVIKALQEDLSIAHEPPTKDGESRELNIHDESNTFLKSGTQLTERWETISTLDGGIDEALRGGIPVGYITEITGESATGKTQFLLTLLLSAQLPPPLGISRSTIYISTEDLLPTTRLAQLLHHHPRLSQLPENQKPSLERVLSIPVQDLESQDHILAFQLPLAIRRYKAGLVVLDSVAANYRAEHGSRAPKDLAHRTSLLARLGKLLRDIATSENVAIVVANQVGDRFDDQTAPTVLARQIHRHLHATSPAPETKPITKPRQSTPSSLPPSSPLSVASNSNPYTTNTTFLRPEPQSQTEIHTLDFQQRFFTGWGDDTATDPTRSLKTPALGLGWTNQIACRIALKIESTATTLSYPKQAHGQGGGGGGGGGAGEGGFGWSELPKRRFFRVVFASWAPPMMEMLEYQIRSEGIVSLPTEKVEGEEDEDAWILEGL